MKKLVILILAVMGISAARAQKVPATLTPEQKLFGLSTLWSEAKYNEAFFDNIGEAKWDSAYRAFIRPVMETPDDYAYARELQRFCALLRDGHSRVHYSNAPIITTFFDKFQWYLSCIEGKPIVKSISSKWQKEIPVGSEIVEVNGMPAAEYIEKKVIPYISSSTDYVRMDNAVMLMFQSLKGDSYQVKIKTPAGKTVDMKLTHEVRPEVKADPMYPARPEWKLMEVKWYPGDIAYVALNSFGNPQIVEEFEAAFPELKKAKKLIIDLRNNGGGNTDTGARILTRLTPDTLLVGSRWCTRVHNPAYKSWSRNVTARDTVGSAFKKKAYLVATRQLFEHNGPYLYDVPKERERLVVPTVLLIGHNTASAAEDFLILADGQKHMVKMGQHSNGSTGNPIFYELEGDIRFQICSKKDTYPDGRDFVGCGVKPDIEVVPTVEDFIKGYDRGLQEALKYLKKATL